MRVDRGPVGLTWPNGPTHTNPGDSDVNRRPDDETSESPYTDAWLRTLPGAKTGAFPEQTSWKAYDPKSSTGQRPKLEYNGHQKDGRKWLYWEDEFDGVYLPDPRTKVGVYRLLRGLNILKATPPTAPAPAVVPVTEAWLRQVGAADKPWGRDPNGDPVYKLFLGPAQWFEFPGGGRLLIDHGPGKPGGWELADQAAVRQFAAALGIPLTEADEDAEDEKDDTEADCVECGEAPDDCTCGDECSYCGDDPCSCDDEEDRD